MLFGTEGGSARQYGSPRSTAASVSDTSLPSNARLPVSISNSTHPNAQMSLRLSAGRPFACSGDIYAAVPRRTPTPLMSAGDVIVGDNDNGDGLVPAAADDSASLAKPKSSTFTELSGFTLMFAGFRSR